MKRQNIILIGFMGAGKTSVGRKLAQRRGKPLIDTDQMIEKSAGMTISKIFETQGEEAFRQLEVQTLEKLQKEAQGEIISVGGGLPLKEDNRIRLKQLGIVIYLKTRPETVISRLQGDTTRPLLQGDHVEERVQELLSVRDPIYTEAAHYIVTVDDKRLERIADEIEICVGNDITGKGEQQR